MPSRVVVMEGYAVASPALRGFVPPPHAAAGEAWPWPGGDDYTVSAERMAEHAACASCVSAAGRSDVQRSEGVNVGGSGAGPTWLGDPSCHAWVVVSSRRRRRRRRVITQLVCSLGLLNFR